MNRLVNIKISVDTAYYTPFALFSAFLIYRFLISNLYLKFCAGNGSNRGLKNYKARLKNFWLEKVAERGAKKIFGELAPGFILVFCACFMLFIFEPVQMYATNIIDFWFDIYIMIKPVLGVFFIFFAGGIALIIAIYIINLFFSRRLIIYRLVVLVGFILFFLAYIQGNWLSGNLPKLNGDAIVWQEYGKYERPALLTVAVVVCMIFGAIVWKYKLKRAVKIAAISACAVTVMLVSAFISTMVTTDALVYKDTYLPTNNNLNNISNNKNFLIFVADTVDSGKFFDIISNDEDFKGILDDFTYYPDTLSVYPHTLKSVPQILTGFANHNQENFMDYCTAAYNHSPLFEKLKQNKYQINLYSDNIVWSGKRNFDIKNSVSIYNYNIDFPIFTEQELKYIKFKYLPFEFKQNSDIESLDFDLSKKYVEDEEVFAYGDEEFYSYIKQNSVLIPTDENYFQYVHINGAHSPFNLDKNLNVVDNGTRNDKIAAVATIIKSYIQRLKDSGAYDNSVIIIMSDHGCEQIDELTAAPWLDRVNPILFIKGLDEKHDLQISDKPITYDDLQQAYSELLDGKKSVELFTNAETGRTRTVLSHEWWDGEGPLTEFITTGKAWETDRFIPTGTVYTYVNAEKK